jgi:GntR family transcriptional regulator
VEFKQQQAIYLQIADYICEKILNKEWLVDEKILSIRELAIDVAVNPNTVVRAYDYLEEQGIIYKQRGIGYFVAKDAIVKIIHLKKEYFFREDLPWLFKSMRLLGISFEELQAMYDKA